MVNALLARHYRLSGHLERLATEKDDTFRLRTGTADHLVKVSPPDEAVAVVALQTAVMRHLETEAPHPPRPAGQGDHRRQRQRTDRDERRRGSSPAPLRLRRRCRPGADEPRFQPACQGRADARASGSGSAVIQAFSGRAAPCVGPSTLRPAAGAHRVHAQRRAPSANSGSVPPFRTRPLFRGWVTSRPK